MSYRTFKHTWLALLLLSGCARAQAQSPPSPPPLPPGQVQLPPAAQQQIGLRLATVTSRRVAAELTAPGRLAFIPEREAHVTVPVTARVLASSARVGDYVAAGSVLATLDSPDLGRAQSDFLQAEAKLRLAQETLARQQVLFARQYAARKDYLQARSDREAAAIEYERAMNQLGLLGIGRGQIAALAASRRVDSRLFISAPSGGRVTRKALSVGEQIAAGTTVFTVDDTSALWAVIDVHEQDLARVQPGMSATITAAAYPGRAWAGRVETIGDELDHDTHTAKVRVRVNNARGLLKQEMYVQARLHLPSARTLPCVPASAVILKDRQRVLYVAFGPERFSRRQVETGAEEGGWLPITRGVRAGERVVASGALLLDAAREDG